MQPRTQGNFRKYSEKHKLPNKQTNHDTGEKKNKNYPKRREKAAIIGCIYKDFTYQNYQIDYISQYVKCVEEVKGRKKKFSLSC